MASNLGKRWNLSQNLERHSRNPEPLSDPRRLDSKAHASDDWKPMTLWQTVRVYTLLGFGAGVTVAIVTLVWSAIA